jgi:hypothetical protein
MARWFKFCGVPRWFNDLPICRVFLDLGSSVIGRHGMRGGFLFVFEECKTKYRGTYNGDTTDNTAHNRSGVGG